jgi:hypothetical protein
MSDETFEILAEIEQAHGVLACAIEAIDEGTIDVPVLGALRGARALLEGVLGRVGGENDGRADRQLKNHGYCPSDSRNNRRTSPSAPPV